MKIKTKNAKINNIKLNYILIKMIKPNFTIFQLFFLNLQKQLHYFFN